MAVFIVLGVLGPIVGVRQLDAASGAEIRLADAQSALDALLRTQLAEETALRGYVATRDAFFLDPDGPPNRRFPEEARALEARLRAEGFPSGAQAIANMRAVHATWEKQVALPLLRDPRAPDADSRQTFGKLLTDEMRIDAQMLQEQLELAGDRVNATLRREIDATLAISVGVVTIFAIVALWYAVGRAQAVARLAHERVVIDALQRALRVQGDSLPCTRMGTAYASANREARVGGDLLDSWRTGKDRGWFLIADASGKGIGAARHAAFAQYALRALVLDADDPAAVMKRFNQLFLMTFDDPTAFIVLFLGAFDARTRTLRYASAGHGTAYVRRRGAFVERLPPTGTLIGVDADESYRTETVPLALGDVVLLATDGLTEARNADGEMIGEERVAAILAHGPADPQGLCDTLAATAEAHSGGVQDDLAIVALRVVADHETMAAPVGGLGASQRDL